MTFDPGPRLARPIRSAADVAALETPPMAEAAPFVGEALALLRRELDGKVPVIRLRRRAVDAGGLSGRRRRP